jgi:peptide/nickel transport system ATP-binding protein
MNKHNMFLSVKDLVVEYTSDKQIIHAVNGVSFEMGKGETLGLVGETGAGKTTIAKSILRILPDPPAKIKSGQIFVNEEDLMGKSEKEMLSIRGNKIAMIFQDPMTALNPVRMVGDQIAEVLSIHDKSLSKKQTQEKTMEMMEMVGITGDRYVEDPFQFSGGMKQRVVSALALACNPEFLLADEPTTALDVTIQAQVLSMIKDLQKKYNTSMLLITHDLGVVAETCDSVAIIYAGEIVERGTKEDIFDHPAHPYTLGLFASLPKLNEESSRLNPIRGMTPDPSKLPVGCKFHPRCKMTTPECMSGEMPVIETMPGHFCRCCRICGQES